MKPGKIVRPNSLGVIIVRGRNRSAGHSATKDITNAAPIRRRLTHMASFDEIDIHLDAHVTFLEQNYAAGSFIASGPMFPRTGGIIIATAETRAILEDILETDPFKQKGLARYTITEFRPSMMTACLK